MPKFTISVRQVLVRSAKVEIEAASIEEAQGEASDLARSDSMRWDTRLDWRCDDAETEVSDDYDEEPTDEELEEAQRVADAEEAGIDIWA